MLLTRLILKIGHYNRTGKKWLSHYDIWLLDELVEKALLLGIEPSIPTPRLLATRIATSESFGIIPIGSSIAKEVEIPLLPPLNLHTVPHHNDLPSQTLTQLSTKPCNIYRYIQLRQRAPVPVIPVYNFAEYKFFKSHVDTFRINMSAGRAERSPEQIWKATDYIKFAVFWNQAVMSQSPQILEAHLRLYFKLPEQLLRHHKKTLQWKSARATLYMGPNAELLKPIQEILGDANRLAIVLPAIPLEPEQVDFRNDSMFISSFINLILILFQILLVLTWNLLILWPFVGVLLKNLDQMHLSIPHPCQILIPTLKIL
jgi:hypothetical protein